MALRQTQNQKSTQGSRRLRLLVHFSLRVARLNAILSALVASAILAGSAFARGIPFLLVGVALTIARTGVGAGFGFAILLFFWFHRTELHMYRSHGLRVPVLILFAYVLNFSLFGLVAVATRMAEV